MAEDFFELCLGFYEFLLGCFLGFDGLLATRLLRRPAGDAGATGAEPALPPSPAAAAPAERRNPARAKQLLETACHRGHAPACFNLAVMYKNGDDGVRKNTKLFEHYKEITQQLVDQAGGMRGTKAS